jgi:hypothetical protein
MAHRTIRPDLAGTDETLEALLERLRSLKKLAPRRRNPPPDFGHFVTSRRPRGGAGGAEAPIPAERSPADLCAPA